MKKVVDKILNSKPVLSIIDTSKQIILPGFEGMNLYFVTSFFAKGIQKGLITTRAAAISFNVFLAIFPTFILLLTLIPFVPIEDFQEKLFASFQEIIPRDAFKYVEATLEDLIHKKHSTLLSLGFVLAIYYASNSINALLEGLSGSYNLVMKRSPLKQRLLAFFLILALVVLIFVAVIVILSSNFVFAYIESKDIISNEITLTLLTLGKWIIVVFFFNSAISILYNVANVARKKWRFFSPGSIAATLLSIAASLGFAFFINNFGQYNKLYGSVGGLMVGLLWIYFNSLILLLGFELNVSINRAKEDSTTS